MILVAICSVALLVPNVNAGDSNVSRIQFLSNSLGMKRDVHVYVPPDYEQSKDARYPVVFALHGLGGNGGDFFSHGRMKEHLDFLIKRELIRPLIVVAPNGDNGYWTNHFSTKDGMGEKWADYVSDDLVAEIDRRYRTLARREGRALVGVSMGGFGALSIGLGNPEKFHAIISLSGAIFSTPPGCAGGQLSCRPAKNKEPKCSLTAPTCAGKLGRIAKRSHYRNAWGFPPNLDHWKKINPMELLAAVVPDDAFQPRLYLQCGASDKRFHDLFKEASRLLEVNGVTHTARSVKGGRHSWKLWESETRRWLRWLEDGWAANKEQGASSKGHQLK